VYLTTTRMQNKSRKKKNRRKKRVGSCTTAKHVDMPTTQVKHKYNIRIRLLATLDPSSSFFFTPFLFRAEFYELFLIFVGLCFRLL